MILQRLKGHGKVSEVLRSGCRTTSGPLLLSAVSDEDTLQTPAVYVAVTIAKRVAPSAVLRNRVRRLLREAVRTCLRTWTGHSPQHSMFVVLVWRNRPEAAGRITLHDVLPHVRIAMEKAVITLHRGL